MLCTWSVVGLSKCTAMPRQVTAKLTDAVDKHVLGILKENEKRIKEINTPFNPIKGEGCGDKRFLLFLPV